MPTIAEISQPWPAGWVSGRDRAVMDYSRMRAVASTRYSSERPNHFTQLRNEIDMWLESRGCDMQRGLLRDNTAHVGGFCLAWAASHPAWRVDAIESDRIVARVLAHNVHALALDARVTVHHANAMMWHDRAVRTAGTRLAYVDPPWGGLDYSAQTSMSLHLAGRPVGELVSRLRREGWNVVLKVPRNFAWRSVATPERIVRIEGERHLAYYIALYGAL